MSVRDPQLHEPPDGLVTVAPDVARGAVTASGCALFVVPNKHADGFRASIRGHMFELADPASPHGLVPTPEDLLTAAIASDVAWFARGFLRTHGLDDDVSVAARLRSSQGPGLGELDVTVEVSRGALAMGPALGAALEDRLSAHSALSPRLHIRQA